jgi:O-antigen ligase
LIGLFLTFKRAAWVAIFFEAIVFVVLIKPQWKKIFWGGLILLTGLTLLVIISYPKTLPYRLVVHSVKAQELRIEAVGLAWNIIKEHPLTGIGLGRGSFHSYYPKEHSIVHTHNIFLNTAVEIGVPGLLLLVLIFVILFSKLFRALTRESALRRKMLITGIFISTLGFVIANLFDCTHYGWPSMVFWLLAGLGMGLATHEKKQQYNLI